MKHPFGEHPVLLFFFISLVDFHFLLLLPLSLLLPSAQCSPKQRTNRTLPAFSTLAKSEPASLSLFPSLYFFYKSLTPQSKLFFDFFSSHRRAAKSSPFSEILILTCRYLLKSSGRESPFLRRSLFSDSPSIISSHQFDPMSRKSRTDTEGILLLLRRSLGCVNSCNLMKTLSGT